MNIIILRFKHVSVFIIPVRHDVFRNVDTFSLSRIFQFQIKRTPGYAQ